MCDIRKDLYENIFLTGGNTMFKGIEERMAKELINIAPSSMNVKVGGTVAKKTAVWIGASIFCNMPSCKPLWISKEEYEELGPEVVHS